MRRELRWVLITFGLIVLPVFCVGCRDGEDAITTGAVRGRATTVERATGRLLVLRLGDGVRVLRQRALARAPRSPRGAFNHWKGRWEVRTADGRVLAAGRFRIGRRRHALFGDVGGPARAVDVALEHPVVWLRVPVSPEAKSLVLYDDHGRRRLGEVAL